MSVQRKCPKCGSWNGENDFCHACGELISPQIIEEKREATLESLWSEDKETAFDRFLFRWKHSGFFLFRWIYYTFYSIGVVFFAIASFLAYITIGSNG